MHILQSRKLTPRQFWLRIIAAGVLVLIIAGAWIVSPRLMQHYKVAKQQRALTQAKEFLAQKDYNNSQLALKVAFEAIPGDPQTIRVAAELLEAVGSPAAMPLRRRAVAANPDSPEDHAALIKCALRFGDINAARDAVAAVPEKLAGTPAILKAGLAFAMATNNAPVADAFFDRLQIAEPDNENLEIMHNLLLLRSPRAHIASGARAKLDELALIPRNTLFIQRELLRTALLRKAYPEASKLASTIIATPGATMDDRLNLANIHLNIDHEPFDRIFTELAPLAAKTPEDTAVFARWMLVIGQPAKAKSWLDTLSSTVGSDPRINTVRADLAVALEAWDELATLIEAGAWGAIPKDSVRLAFTARLVAQSNNAQLRPQLWEEALRVSSKSKTGLNALYRLSGVWNWSDQLEGTLWAIVQNFPDEAWAHETLFSAYRKNRNTDKIRDLMNTLMERDNTTPRYKYDWALLSLLTQKRTTWTPAKQAMHDLYQSDTSNGYYAVGYAFALAQSDMETKGMEILATLPPGELTAPSRAPYLAFIYGMNRLPERFEEAAALQPGLTDLMPEERELFSLGRTALTRPEPKKKAAAKPADTTEPEPAVETPAETAHD